jgi:hypothetical protein
MVEAAIACALLLYLLLLALPGIELQALLGAILTVVGLVGGGSAGLVYHFALRRALLRLGVGTKGWLWTPVSRHNALDDQAKRQVLPWFRIGAAGFILCVAGIGMLAVASLRAAVL